MLSGFYPEIFLLQKFCSKIITGLDFFVVFLKKYFSFLKKNGNIFLKVFQ